MINKDKLSKYTEKIRNSLPFWFSMKKKKDTLGLQFLSAFGFELDDIEKILKYAYDQTKIMTADAYYTDILYLVDLESSFDIEKIKHVRTSTDLLIQTNSLFELFNLGNNYGLDENIGQPNYYFIDKERKIIYLTEPHDNDTGYEHGIIEVCMKDDKNKSYALRQQNIWNFFDDFGALLSCPRMFGEKNLSYKERILDVFRYPASSSRDGIINGISRELNLRKRFVWNDDKDFIIKNKMVLLDTVYIDNKNIPIKDLKFTSENYIVIQEGFKSKRNCIVSFVVGLEVVALVDKRNTKISNELIKSNGDHTDLMKNYIKILEETSSFLWGKFKYNEGMWVINDSEYKTEHFSFINSRLDASISGFSSYNKCKGE